MDAVTMIKRIAELAESCGIRAATDQSAKPSLHQPCGPGTGKLMFRQLRPLLFAMDPETAHGLTLKALELLPLRTAPDFGDRLMTRIGRLTFPTPIGLAAGFDKDARVWRAMLGLGFGLVEVGTLTPRPQLGHPHPRVFRLEEDRAIINRLGFNNGGLAAALPRLTAHPQVGANLGANKDSSDRIADYAAGVAAVGRRAAWITLNVSSPNTPGLRGLQGEALPELLSASLAARGPDGPHLFLKVAPDLDARQIDAIARAAQDARLDALIISNTTLARPATLRSPHAGEAGGLSGAPLQEPAMAVLRAFADRLFGTIPLIAAGGIGSAADVLARIKTGASAVQLYTALVYEGPALPARLSRELLPMLDAEGFATVSEAVGFDRADPAA